MFRLWKWSNWELSMFRYDQFQDACCWEKKIYIIVISICFSYNTVNVFLEGDRAGSWWKHSYFWMRQALTWPWHGGEVERAQNDVRWGPDHPPLNVISMGPEFLATALSAIMISGPSTVYHVVFTPILPFHYCNPTEEFFSTWRWKVHNRHPHKQVTLLQAIDDACNYITGGSVTMLGLFFCHTRSFFQDV